MVSWLKIFDNSGKKNDAMIKYVFSQEPLLTSSDTIQYDVHFKERFDFCF